MFADRLKALRKQKRLTQSDIAKVAGVTYQAVGKWEKGISEPDFETLKKLASFLGVTTDYLFGTKTVTLQADTERKLQDILYYTDPETAELANEIKDNPELRMLFDVSRHAKKEDILTGVRIMKGFIDND